jgi:type II secretory pathway component PulF
MPFLNPVYIALLKTGEETGHLKPALKYTSEAAAAEFAHQCEKLLDRVQPLFLIGTGCLFLSILYGTLFPLYQEMNRLFVTDLSDLWRVVAYV